MKKYLLLTVSVLLIGSALALDRTQYRKAKLEFENINSKTKLETLCGTLTKATLKDACIAEINAIELELVKELIRGVYLDHTRDKAGESITCKIKYEKLLAAAEQPFNGTETCKQLETAWVTYQRNLEQ